MESILSQLNPEQLEAVTTTEGFVRVIAGAGSGKTRALTARFAYLVNEMGVLPGGILCVTFTNKAANEMRRRIHNLTGDNDTGYINTFHGFCVSILQEDSFAVQYPKSFLVLDNSDIDSMLRIIYEERGLSLRDMTFSSARDMIEMQKLVKRPEYYLDLITMPIDTLKEKYLQATEAEDIIFYGYLYQEKKCFGLDYNDLLLFSLYIFRENPEIRLKWQQRLEYIMIDEFQDIDPPQYELMKILCDYHKNLFVVGDPDQTIYTWRGANIRFLLDFENEFPGTHTVMMNRNYRSNPQILAVANSLIDKNRNRIRKELIPMRPDGEKVVCSYCSSGEKEALWIQEKIQELMAQGVPPEEITVLYRAHYVSRSIEEAFIKAKLPYTIYSGVQFFNRAEIKDALSYLRMIAYKDDLSFARIVNQPKRNIGNRRMEFIREQAEKNSCTLYEAMVRNLDNEIFRGTGAAKFVKLIERHAADYADRAVSEVLAAILSDSGYEAMLRTEGSQERLDNLAELRQAVYEYETGCGEEATLTHYLSHVALMTNADTCEHEGKVKMMTVHAAKGLEFKNVFLAGMNEGIFPSSKVNTLPGMEEERRLAFVAVTRAEDRLFLTECEGTTYTGSPRYPSRFLLDIDEQLLDYPQRPRQDLIRDARLYIDSATERLGDSQQQDLYPIGTRVVHDIIGIGTVQDIDLKRKAYIIRFDAMQTERAISFKAKLRRV
ncbi:MAG: UvrD-helicase domain-containing protein [Oscillospiraceae bacterium]|nr:UvrD-helicase domain-containing protein [Oscillospiraceae bacterium]